MITPDEITRLRELAAKATPLPWEAGRDYTGLPCIEPDVVGNNLGSSWIVCYENRDYICAAANAMPAVLDEVERLRWLADHIDDQITQRLAGMQADLAAALKRAEVLRGILLRVFNAARDETVTNWNYIAELALEGLMPDVENMSTEQIHAELIRFGYASTASEKFLASIKSALSGGAK